MKRKGKDFSTKGNKQGGEKGTRKVLKSRGFSLRKEKFKEQDPNQKTTKPKGGNSLHTQKVQYRKKKRDHSSKENLPHRGKGFIEQDKWPPA